MKNNFDYKTSFRSKAVSLKWKCKSATTTKRNPTYYHLLCHNITNLHSIISDCLGGMELVGRELKQEQVECWHCWDFLKKICLPLSRDLKPSLTATCVINLLNKLLLLIVIDYCLFSYWIIKCFTSSYLDLFRAI